MKVKDIKTELDGLDNYEECFFKGDFEEINFPSPETCYIKEKIVLDIRNIIDKILTPREVKVLCMLFGINMNADYTLEEAGKQIDVTRERTRQIKIRSLRKLHFQIEYNPSFSHILDWL